MAVPTLADFCQRFPETEGADAATVLSHINAAAIQVPASVWGDIQSEGILYLARHTLWLDPSAQDMAGRPDIGHSAESVWFAHYKHLARQVGGPTVST